MAKTISTRKMVMTALLAALTAIGSGARIVIPLSIGGTTAFHLGNIFCALSGILLGPWLGGLAAGLGSAIYDMTGAYISEAWITFLTKGAYGIVAGMVAWSGKKGLGCGKAVLSAAAGALTYAALYLVKSFLYNGLLVQGLTPDAALLALTAKLPATIFNAVVAIVAAPVLAMAIRKALDRAHLSLD